MVKNSQPNMASHLFISWDSADNYLVKHGFIEPDTDRSGWNYGNKLTKGKSKNEDEKSKNDIDRYFGNCSDRVTRLCG